MKETIYSTMKSPINVANLEAMEDREPTYALVENTDLVITKFDETFSVLYGRCHHRGALMADGHVDGMNLICGVHNWDYRVDTGVSEYNNAEVLHPFNGVLHEGDIYVDKAEVIAFEELHPQSFDREEYQGTYADTHPENTEPYTSYIKE